MVIGLYFWGRQDMIVYFLFAFVLDTGSSYVLAAKVVAALPLLLLVIAPVP